VIRAYGARRADGWWQDNAATFARHAKLAVFLLIADDTSALQSLAARAMTLTCTVQDGNVWLASATQTIELTPQRANRCAMASVKLCAIPRDCACRPD
jgi:uncharacterized protein YaeQ